MVGQTLVSVFAHAAVPQKLVLATLATAIPVMLAATGLALTARGGAPAWGRLLCGLRWAGPALGLLVGAMNSFHMAQTIQRVPFDPNAKQLAPGILEVSTLVGLGALVGLLAAIAAMVLSWAEVRQPGARRSPG